jgi:predicted phosphodiesterase
MKKLISLLTLVFVGGGCQTSPVVQKQTPFEKFTIEKMVEDGIQDVEFSPSDKAWPEVNVEKAGRGLAVNSQTVVMAVVGDTGCRLKEWSGGSAYQRCHLTDEWPYPEIAKKIASEKYDFLIHTGDYHYREHCTDPKLCPIYTKSIGYTWNAWWDDFYGPSQVLFKKSPVLLVRGNHEDCQRAHSGWGPLSPLNKKFTDSCEAIEPYQWIEIGDLVLINFDDSAFEDRNKLTPAEMAQWTEKFKEILTRIESLRNKKEIWFLTHKPVMGYVPNREDAEPESITQNLKSVLTESGLIKKIDYILSGHIHNQQIVMNDPDIKQLIVAHTATSLDPFGRKITNQNIITTTDSKFSFGYALFERKGFKKWNWNFKNASGQLVLSCQVDKQKVNCQ